MRCIPYVVLGVLLAACQHTNVHTRGGIVDCRKLRSCADPAGKTQVAWSDLHETLFKAGLEKLLNSDLCRNATGSSGASLYVAPNPIRIADPQCSESLKHGTDVHQAIDLLKAHKIFEIIEFKRLEAFSIDGGVMVGAIAFHSYSLGPQSGEPRRESFSQYLFLQNERGVEVRWVATVAS